MLPRSPSSRWQDATGTLASPATKKLVHDHRVLAILIIAVVGATLQGTLWGWLQWQLLRRRVPGLQCRRWTAATTVAAFIVWVLVLAPRITDVLAKGGNTLLAFRNGFIQALVLGPLIGLSQAMALRPLISRWAWWFLANVTTYLSGTLLRQFGVWLQHELSQPARTPGYFPGSGIRHPRVLDALGHSTASSHRPTATSTPGRRRNEHQESRPRHWRPMTADVVIPGPAVTVSAGRDGEGGSGGPFSRLCLRPAARRVCFTLEAFASTLWHMKQRPMGER